MAVALALVAALPLLIGPGIVATRAGGDSPFLLQRVQQLSQVLREGAFPARWMPDGAHGLGYPFFNYYAVLPYYLAAALDLAGCGVLWGIKLTQTLGFMLAGAGMYGLAREGGAGRMGSLVASASYTFAPFHLVNVYVRGDALSEFYAYALYPWILWSALRLRRGASPARLVCLAASYALLVLTHNISALIFSPLLVLWLLVEALVARNRAGWRTLAWGLLTLALGLALSAWYWLPALREQGFVQLQDQTTGYLHFAGHFRAANLVQRGLIHDYTVAGRCDPFNMGLAQAVLALLGLLALAWRALAQRRLTTLQGVAALALLGYTWLITPSSRWVWEHIPLLPYVQFPWRLLSVQALVLALMVSNIPNPLPKRLGHSLGLACIGLVALAGLGGIKVDRLSLREGEITPQRLMLYETYSGNIGSTIRYEYLPRQMAPRPFISAVQLNGGEKPPPLAIEGELRSARLVGRGAAWESWELEPARPALLAFHTVYFPGWRATVDGQEREVEPLEGLGLIGLRLAPGMHRVTLRLGPTRVRRLAGGASLGALWIWLGLAVFPGLRSRRYRLGGAIMVGLLLLSVLWLRIAPQPRGDPIQARGPLVMDFSRAPYLHEEPEGLDLGAAHLKSYHLSATVVRPDDILRVALAWQQPRPELIARVELAATTAHLFDLSPQWAEAQEAINAEQVELSLRLPPDIPPGLYVLRLSVLQDGKPQGARTAHGIELGTVALEPVQVLTGRRAAGQEPVLAHFGPEHVPPCIALLEARATILHPGMLEVALTWRAERQAPLNYMLSLRLNRADGSRVVARDVPPLLGGYPTSLWQPGELIGDRVRLSLPEGLPPGRDYQLEVVLYDRLTLKGAGSITLKGIALP